MTNPHDPGARVTVRGISHVLLDIEGTTCPVSYVAEVLFPYAAEHLGPFLEQKGGDPIVQSLVQDVETAWKVDHDSEARALRSRPDARLADYLQLLIRQDRKLTALKSLQGMVWREGYRNGSLRAPLFPDVAAALSRWQQQGLVLAVYSSGSVQAQQQLYAHSDSGDLRHQFSHWFDTRVGPKQEAQSYVDIAQLMATDASTVLFISDALMECKAAQAAGMKAVFSSRPGNPAHDAGGFACVRSYRTLDIQPSQN